MKKTWFSIQKDEYVFRVLDLFLQEVGKQLAEETREASAPPPVRDPNQKKSPGPVARVIEALEKGKWLEKHGWSIEGLRERIYPLLWEGIHRGFLFIRPPREQRLERDLSLCFKLPHDHVHVVPVRGPTAIDHVERAGAQLVLDLIKQVGRRKDRVHVALGSGSTSRGLARHLARLLTTETDCPPLTLHALTSGFRVDQPASAPSTFFSFFDDRRLDIEFVGLFSEAIVPCSQYPRVKKAYGVKRSFDRASEIDICTTSLAWKDDQHGLLNQLLREYENVDRADYQRMKAYLERAAWCGDVQYLPYSPSGPIPLTTGFRAVTLFEIEELVDMVAGGDRHVVLLSGPCAGCGKTRTQALRPLLEEPKLRVWSHLVCDVQTAEELVPPLGKTSSS